jgi:hypothetical protein
MPHLHLNRNTAKGKGIALGQNPVCRGHGLGVQGLRRAVVYLRGIPANLMHSIKFADFDYPLSHPSPVSGGRCQRRMGVIQVIQNNTIIHTIEYTSLS